MDLSKIEGYEQAVKAMRVNVSPRARYLAQLESYVDGTQYMGQPDWFCGDVPLWERAPAIVYPIVKSAIDSNTDLVFGEGRFPLLTTHPDEDDEMFDNAGLNRTDSEIMDRFMAEVQRQSCFRTAIRESFTSAQGESSSVQIYGVRGGKLFIDTVKAQWSTPEFGRDGKPCKLTIQYPYLTQYRSPDGKWHVRAKFYKRVIDEMSDVTFLPGEARTDGVEPKWSPDPMQSIQHRLSFCPVNWYPFMRGCSAVNDFDGRAIHANVLDEVRGLDMALSQKHRAALYCGDPQWTEIGVDPGFVPGTSGRIVSMPATPQGGSVGPGNPVTTGFRDMGGNQRQGRKKSPGDVWQYPDQGTKVQLHTLPGEALKAVDDHCQDLRSKLAESMAVVFMDQEHLDKLGQISGRALEALKARQLDRCDQYRADAGEKLVIPGMELLLRVVKKTHDNGTQLRIGGLDKVMPLLSKFEIADAVGV